jgi:hypothetical protein
MDDAAIFHPVEKLQQLSRKIGQWRFIACNSCIRHAIDFPHPANQCAEYAPLSACKDITLGAAFLLPHNERSFATIGMVFPARIPCKTCEMARLGAISTLRLNLEKVRQSALAIA